jgi:competence protein ComEC
VLGLLTCLVAGLGPLAFVVGWLAWLPAAWIGAVAHWFGERFALRMPWPEGAGGVLLLGLVSGGVVVALLVRSGRVRRIIAGALLLSMMIGAGVGLAGRAVTWISRPTDWTVAMCDVGQGDATVIRDGGVVAVIDTGPLLDPFAHCLDELGISRVDLLVLTHFDQDHVGGARALVGRAATVLHGPPDGEQAQALLDAFAGSGTALVRADESVRGRLGGLRWHVLWPRSAVPVEAGNAASVALAVEGPLSAVFLGDLGADEQRRVRSVLSGTDVDVVKVSHHGSADQDAGLYAAMRATVGLIGVGADNGYGHPTDDVLSLLQNSGTLALRTDRDGLILVSRVDDRIAVWTAERSGAGDGGRR